MSKSEEPHNAKDSSDFSTKFSQARRVSTLSGDICKFVGFILPLLTVVVGIIALSTGEIYGSVGVFGIAILLLISSAPIIAFGNNANELKRQTELLALQTWQAQKEINPELEDFRVY